MMTGKEQLRLWLKSKRMALNSNDVNGDSKLISEKFINHLNWQFIKNVHCYEEIESLNEISTSEIKDHFASYKHINLAIQEKHGSLPQSSEVYDLIILPTLGFDGKGNRMGWGGGFYDKFLAMQPNALKIGLCYQMGFIKNGIPVEKHDIPMDIVITETKVYKFSP